jgi:hypothetical protein
MKSRILDENFKPLTFRVINFQREVVEEEIDANDLEKLETLASQTESKLLILQVSCGNPDRCEKGWHDAMLYFGNNLWVQVDSVSSPMIPTMIGVGKLN